MRKVTEDQNTITQPVFKHKVFNNWDVITDGWYIVCPSNELKVNKVATFDVCGQKVCVFRDSKSAVHGMDGFCVHMGVDLGIGKVVKDRVQCFFHHWQYDKDGKCQHIPAQNEIPKKACLTKYKVEENYGFIWIHPDGNTDTHILEIPELEGFEVKYSHGEIYERRCHHHITMINGIDPQHLSTVHGINMQMDIEITQDSTNVINIELNGKTPSTKPIEKITKKILGDNYAYSMKYADGCVGGLTVMKNVLFFGKENIIPELHMIFAYQILEKGRIQVVPIFLTKKRKGTLGYLKSQFFLIMTKIAFHALQGEDGQVYENIRFNTHNLLKMDAPIGKYIQYINKLKPSKWSSNNES